MENVGSLKSLVAESDMVLSVLVPAAATKAVGEVAIAIRAVGTILYADALQRGDVGQMFCPFPIGVWLLLNISKEKSLYISLRDKGDINT